MLLERLHEAVAAGRPVVIDTTHMRPSRHFLLTQQLKLARQMEKIG